MDGTAQVTMQLIAHDKAVFDLAFCRGTDIFGSVGADGSGVPRPVCPPRGRPEASLGVRPAPPLSGMVAEKFWRLCEKGGGDRSVYDTPESPPPQLSDRTSLSRLGQYGSLWHGSVCVGGGYGCFFLKQMGDPGSRFTIGGLRRPGGNHRTCQLAVVHPVPQPCFHCPSLFSPIHQVDQTGS